MFVGETGIGRTLQRTCEAMKAAGIQDPNDIEKVRALGVSSASRFDALPDVPTIAEAGVPGFEASSWHMIVTPAGTPDAIVSKLRDEFRILVALPEVQQMSLSAFTSTEVLM